MEQTQIENMSKAAASCCEQKRDLFSPDYPSGKWKKS
jgi:hypothetical protein